MNNDYGQNGQSEKVPEGHALLLARADAPAFPRPIEYVVIFKPVPNANDQVNHGKNENCGSDLGSEHHVPFRQAYFDIVLIQPTVSLSSRNLLREPRHAA
ncbi:MAG: hypothetical protein J0H41_11600 [Rhizobiales bacterium]|nr:hypothetical protein [Hyphomicrobiales bacterium]